VKKILVATDGSEHSDKTIREAIKVAGSLETEVTVVNVLEEPPSMPYTYALTPSDLVKKIIESHNESSKQILAQAEKSFKENGIIVKTVSAKGHPAEEICKLAEKGKYDLVIIGSRGLGRLQEMFLGSVSNKVAHCVKSHVMVIK
jgi:nucleotide-binding universal stress UspA family protein